jgi:hypothetical protein
MRAVRIARSLGLASALLALASGGSAGTLTGSLSILVGGLPPLGVSASGTGTSTTGGVTLPASVFATTGASVPGTTPFVTRVIVTAANRAGAFTGTPLHGAMGVQGRVRLLRGGFTAFSIPLTASGTRGVGLGGAPIQSGTSASLLSIAGGSWTTGPVTLTGIGAASNLRTVALTGSDQRTAMGAGTLTLVTPIRITHSALGSVAAFGVLQLTFAPEPGAAVLLLAAGALLVLGVRRARLGERTAKNLR